MPGLWVERTFDFESLTAADFPRLVDRLRATARRIEDAVREVPREVLTRRDGESWSLQEQVGHLLELDALHDGRLDDYDRGAEVLRAADMENRGTRRARYNERGFEDVLGAFRAARGRLVARLEGWDHGRRVAVALHPRLQKPMRVVDMLLFAAEHDEHHLARMAELARREG